MVSQAGKAWLVDNRVTKQHQLADHGTEWHPLGLVYNPLMQSYIFCELPCDQLPKPD